MAEDIVNAKISIDLGGVSGTTSSIGKSVGTNVLNKLGTSVGKIAAGVSTGMIIFAGIKKGIEKLVQASPRLQATMSIFSKSLMLILRPMGDVISMLIRPLALLLLKFAVPFYKKSLENINKTSGKIGTVAGAVAGGIGGAKAGAAIGLKGGPMGVAVGAVGGAVAGAIVGGLTGLNIGPMIEDLFKKALDANPVLKQFFIDLGEQLKSIGEWAVQFFGTDLPNFFTVTLPESVKFLGQAFSDFFTIDIPMFFSDLGETIISVWDSIVTFVQDNVITPIQDAWKTLVTWITDYVINPIKNAFMSVVNFISDKINSVLGFFGGGKKKVGDAIITPNGVVQTSPDDYIIATKNPGAMGGSVTINLSINALDKSSIDSATIDKITKAVSNVMKRQLSMRTMEGSGV